VKATIEFNLPEEEDDFNEIMRAKVDAVQFKNALYRLEQRIREILKYNDGEDEEGEKIMQGLLNMIPDLQ